MTIFKKRIAILTGTRADFGKLKSIMLSIQDHPSFDLEVFVTGMHLDTRYGYTVDEIYKSQIKNIHEFNNFNNSPKMEIILSETIKGFSKYIEEIKPELIIVHGDRVEALAAAIVGSINNIFVAHFEGGEVSGTIDESIRHSVTKFSHLHFVTDEKAKKRLIQLGEVKDSIYVIGSPDIDLMDPRKLRPIEDIKKRYEINFEEYSIAMLHPVTSEIDQLESQVDDFCEALIASELNYVVIYPNNDHGSEIILETYKKKLTSYKFRVFPSIRFEYFLAMLKDSDFIIGNSSSGIREAPYYNVPTIDIGTRQKGRVNLESVINSDYHKSSILDSINLAMKIELQESNYLTQFFGKGDSHKQFIKALEDNKLWEINSQKSFQDINFNG